jgi:chorismate mutase
MADLEGYRRELDELDTSLVNILARRFEVTHQVGLYKRDHNLPARDTEREEQQMERIAAKAEAAGLEPDVAQRVLRVIIDEVVDRHQLLQDGQPE